MKKAKEDHENSCKTEEEKQNVKDEWLKKIKQKKNSKKKQKNERKL